MKIRYRASLAPSGALHPGVHRGGAACRMLGVALIALLSPLTAGEAASPRSTPLTLSVKTITIRTGFRWDHCQNIPYNLLTAEGHYLLNPYRQRGRLYLVYDSSVLRRLDTYYRVPVMALSQNGRHYAFAVDGGDLYVDGRDHGAVSSVTGLAISNDGRHVYYGTRPVSPHTVWGTILVRDGKRILRRAAGLADFWISANGASYAIEGPNGSSGPGAPTSIVNGRVVYDSPRSRDHGQIVPPIFLSPDGTHYGYTLYPQYANQPRVAASWMKAIVDGQTMQLVRDPQGSVTRIVQQVTSGGHYTTCNLAGRPFLDHQRYPGQCPIYISDNASHVLVNDGGWKLDGRPVSGFPHWCCNEVDLDRGMVYIYRTVT